MIRCYQVTSSKVKHLFAKKSTFTFTASSISCATMSKQVFSDLLHIFRSSVSAVLPDKLIRNTIKYNEANDQIYIAGEKYDISKKDIYVVGTGKAVQYMAKEVESILGPRIKKGIISVPLGSLNQDIPCSNIFYFEGAVNNLPDENAQATALKVYNLITNLTSNNILLVLISGGGSALLPLPKDPITLDEKSSFIKRLANSGADIIELNTVRKRISALKGGQLAIKAHPADVISLILSDIVGDPLDLIASGPTVENKDNCDAAIKIVKKFNLQEHIPESIRSVLAESVEKKEFPSYKVKNHIIGSNKISIKEANQEANKLNYFPIELSNTVTGNVSEVAQEYVKLTMTLCNYIEDKFDKGHLKAQASSLNIPGFNIDSFDDDQVLSALKSKDICLILGGEITVEVKGSGKGGRNQHLALQFSSMIHEVKKEFQNFEIYLLSAGTDGIDGPTNAAGAIGYLDLVSQAEEANINVNHYLLNNDSYNFYQEFKQGDLHVITGHTNTNVMDIHLILIKKQR